MNTTNTNPFTKDLNKVTQCIAEMNEELEQYGASIIAHNPLEETAVAIIKKDRLQRLDTNKSWRQTLLSMMTKYNRKAVYVYSDDMEGEGEESVKRNFPDMDNKDNKDNKDNNQVLADIFFDITQTMRNILIDTYGYNRG